MTLSANFTSKSVFDQQGGRALTFVLARLSCYMQLLEQLNVASLSRPTVFLQCYVLLLLHFGLIIYTDDDDFEN